MDLLKRKQVLALVLGVLVAGALVMLALRLGATDTGDQSDGKTAAGQEAQSDASAGADQTADMVGKDEADGGSAASEEGLVDCTTVREAELWYVDDAGVVRMFSEAPLGMKAGLSINRGAGVRVLGQDASLEYEGTRCRQLSDGYLSDLGSDLKRYAEGATTFTSSLAQMVDPDRYAAFLRELSACDDATRERVVVHLVVAEDAFEAEETAVETEGEPETLVEPEQSEELYGGRPSAGAME